MAPTPGPWTVNGQRIEADSREAFGTPGRYGVPLVTLVDDPLTRDQAAANLRLIAASPDLHEALTMVRDADEDCGRDGLSRIPFAARARIDAALAKAGAL